MSETKATIIGFLATLLATGIALCTAAVLTGCSAEVTHYDRTEDASWLQVDAGIEEDAG